MSFFTPTQIKTRELYVNQYQTQLFYIQHVSSASSSVVLGDKGLRLYGGGFGGFGDEGGSGGGQYDNLGSSGGLEENIPGTPGEDYPIYAEPPETSFACDGQVDGGYYFFSFFIFSFFLFIFLFFLLVFLFF